MAKCNACNGQADETQFAEETVWICRVCRQKYLSSEFEVVNGVIMPKVESYGI